MINIENIIYTMNRLEFLIMVSIKEIGLIYGISYDIELVSDEEILQAIYDMAKKGMLLNQEGRLVLTTVYDQIFDYIKHANDIILVYPKKDTLPVCLGYMGTHLVLVKMAAVNFERIRIEIINPSEFGLYLEEAGYFPEGPDIQMDNTQSVLKVERRVVSNMNLMSIVEVKQQGLNLMIQYNVKKQFCTISYSSIELQRIIEEMLK